MTRRRVFLGLGSNLGDRLAYLRGAVDGLRIAVGGFADVVAVSPVYESEPVGGPDGQGPYLNAVVELRTDLSGQALLVIAGGLEQAAGRIRGEERNGPRTLDVDIVLIGDVRIDEPGLTVPHPRMWSRRFVLQPLNDLAPELLPPDWRENVIGEVWAIGNLEADVDPSVAR